MSMILETDVLAKLLRAQRDRRMLDGSAFVPDLPGFAATGATVDESEREIRDAIAFHVEGMREDGLPIPEPTSKVEYVDSTA